MDAVALLDPFLQVIQSGDTNGPITGAALTSVEKFLMYKIISKFLDQRYSMYNLSSNAEEMTLTTGTDDLISYTSKRQGLAKRLSRDAAVGSGSNSLQVRG
jgi:hypothetical protein